MFFFTSQTNIWVQIGRGKVGLSGNIQVYVKSYISKSKFQVFDIRKEYCLYIQSMRKIHLLSFSIRLWGKSLEISRKFSVGPLF